MRKATCCAVLFVVLGALLANPTIWFWSVFSADYFLGNPSFFRDYRNELMSREYHAYPVKGFIKPQSMFELNASDYSFENFKIVTDNWRVPVILRGQFKDAPIMKWTPHTLADHFRKQAGREFLTVKKNDYNAKGNNLMITHLDSEWMPLDQIIENITNGGTNYLHNANLYFPEDLELYRDLDLKRMGFDRETLLVQMFLGKKVPGEVRGSGSPLHCAAGPNLFIQISSAKKWTMIHPKWSRYVEPNLFRYQVAASSKTAVTHMANATHRWGNFPRWEGTVYPGDAIWIPGWMWHEVENIPSNDWSLAVATRYSTYFQLYETNALFTMLVDFGVKEKACLPGTRFICAAMHPGVEKGFSIQRQSEAAREGTERRIKAGTLETDAE